MHPHPTLGADMALGTFTAALWFEARRPLKKEFHNSPAGYRALQRWLHQHFASPVRVGIESTNTYGEGLAEAMHAAGHEVYLLNPERVACFARSRGQRNKTDPADAVTIAAFVAANKQLTPWQPPSGEQKHLRSLTRARQQLVDTLKQLTNQLRTATGPGREHLASAHHSLRQQLKAIEAEIRAYIEATPLLREAVRCLRTCKGVGRVTAATILAELPPITPDTDPRTLCSWAGLTPRRKQSGQTELRARIGRAGNAYLRQALYMPALVAKRWNPVFAAFATRLKAKGKSTPAILGAIAHKLLRTLIGMLRTRTDFDPNWVQQKI
jgi:transposase